MNLIVLFPPKVSDINVQVLSSELLFYLINGFYKTIIILNY